MKRVDEYVWLSFGILLLFLFFYYKTDVFFFIIITIIIIVVRATRTDLLGFKISRHELQGHLKIYIIWIKYYLVIRNEDPAARITVKS